MRNSTRWTSFLIGILALFAMACACISTPSTTEYNATYVAMAIELTADAQRTPMVFRTDPGRQQEPCMVNNTCTPTPEAPAPVETTPEISGTVQAEATPAPTVAPTVESNSAPVEGSCQAGNYHSSGQLETEVRNQFPNTAEFLLGQIEFAVVNVPEFAVAVETSQMVVTAEGARDGQFLVFVEGCLPVNTGAGDGWSLEAQGANTPGFTSAIVTAWVFHNLPSMVQIQSNWNGDPAHSLPQNQPFNSWYTRFTGNGTVSIDGWVFYEGQVAELSQVNGRFENDSPFPMFQSGSCNGLAGPEIVRMNEDGSFAFATALTKITLTAEDRDRLNYEQVFTNKPWDTTSCTPWYNN